MKGVFEFQVQDKTVGFKFGILALAIAEEKEGKPLSELLELLTTGKVSTKTLLHLLYGAAVQYAEQKSKAVDFTLSDVSDWCEEIGFENIYPAFRSGLTQYLPKNSKSPSKKEKGEKALK